MGSYLSVQMLFDIQLDYSDCSVEKNVNVEIFVFFLSSIIAQD